MILLPRKLIAKEAGLARHLNESSVISMTVGRDHKILLDLLTPPLVADAKQRQGVEAWLSPLQMLPLYRAALARVRDGSGTWFLKHETVVKWLERDSRLLWCSGIRKSSSDH